MSRILDAMRKVSPGDVDIGVRLAAIDRGNLYPVPDERAVGEFERLATTLLHMANGGGGQTVIFASTTSGEGSSYVSYNCARMMATMLERPIAWVDANFNSPTAKLAGQELNLRDLLSDPESLPDMAASSGLVLIGNGRRHLKHVDYLNGGQYERLVRKFEENFFFTCIDAPPILDGVEVGHLAQPALGLVLVVESRRCKHEVVRHGLDRMRSQGVNVLGTVLNKRVFELPEFVYRRF
jgi:Mrp family chromosome partitioning ATPase